jgi:hypothetical protein
MPYSEMKTSEFKLTLIAELAKGNAEIKELISILRCASFSGKFILSSKNRLTMSPGLKETAESFNKLINCM